MITDAAPRAIYAVGAGGPPVTHDVRYRGATSYQVHAAPGIVAACSCGWEKPLEGGRYSGDDLGRLARQHAGIEDEDP